MVEIGSFGRSRPIRRERRQSDFFVLRGYVGVAKAGGFGKMLVSMFGVPPCAVWHGKRAKSLQRSMQEQLICREYVSLQAST